MKRFLIPAACILALICMALSITACGGGTGEKTPKPKPINITVLIDLSDRVIKNTAPSQFERDTAIVDYIVDKFIQETTKQGTPLTKSQNCIRVMFYPQPSLPDIATLAAQLDVDLSKVPPAQKKTLLKNMKQTFSSDLEKIYNKTIESHQWIGCDIWGFFSNKDVDKYCINNEYRNIIVILTDGYLYHKDNQITDGTAHSFLLPQTLSNPGSSLIVSRDGLDNLEVLVLEVNPIDPATTTQISSTLENWFKGMGVQNVEISTTAMPKNTESVIAIVR